MQPRGVKTVPITDVAKMRFLSLNQSGGGGCGGGCSGGEGEGVQRDNSCHFGNCITVESVSYSCWETWEGLILCSGCCAVAAV
jgi:hypothetical protein